MKNLEDLNNQLFEVLQDLKNDTIKPDKAKAMVEISNSIVSTNKTMLDAYKLTNGNAYSDKANQNKLPKPETKTETKPETKTEFTSKEKYAVKLGFGSHGDAIVKMGKDNFDKAFNKQKISK